MTTDHINRNKLDNRPENLRWADVKMQNANQQRVDDCIAKYGVRACENMKEYRKAYEADRYAKHHEEILEWAAAYRAKQYALGRRLRKCPDGKQHWLTDSEFSAMFG